MANSKSKNIQINISIPNEWKDSLESLARIYSVEEERTLSFHDLIRRAVGEKYGFETKQL